MVMIALDAIEDAQVGPDEVDLKIFATDISDRIIEQGKCGLFAKPQVRYVPSGLLHRHFRTTCFGVEISEEIKSRVVFQRLNLACTPYPMTAPWDVIFCQEGLTPLVPDARMRASRTVQSLLADRGLLCTGLGEDLANTTVRPGKTMPPSLC
jgi:chemotaxis protein methyltransferase CheR